MTDNFTRMLQLAESFFDAKNDPDQLAVTDADRERLLRLHSIVALFTWPFSGEGDRLAASVAQNLALPLHIRPH